MEILLPLIEKNPFKSVEPEYIPMPGENSNNPIEESTELQYNMNWARLNPPGPLSLVLWSSDPEYRAGSESLRRTKLHEITIQYQERIQSGQVVVQKRVGKGKLCEVLGMNVENASEENFGLLEACVPELAQVQWVRIHENEKKITFIPSDLRQWSSAKPILWVRERYRSAGEPAQKAEFTLQHLANWIGTRESEGWSMTFPVAEGTMESLKQEWNALNRGLPPTKSESGRRLKEDYAKALGKAQVFQYLAKATEQDD